MDQLIVRGGILPRVKTFCVGSYDVGTPDETHCTPADLQAVVRNFKAISTGANPTHRVPLAKGHEEDASGVLGRTDQPADGWITDCWVEGDYLYTRWEQIPDETAAQINRQEYRYPSAEFYTDPAQGNLPGSGWCLRRVVILGATPPRNKQLGELGSAVKTFADLRFRRVKRYRAGVAGKGAFIRCFSEGAGMDRASMTTALLASGWTQEEIDGVKDDVALGVICAHEMAKASGATPPPPEGGSNSDSPPDKETMIASLVAAGGDAAALSAMSDTDLLAMWQALQAGATPPAPVQASEGNPMPTPTPAPGAMPGGTPTQVILKYAEAAAKVAVHRAMSQYTAGDKVSRVDTICDRLVKEGKAAPARVAKADAVKRTPAGDIRQALEKASHVKAFGEGKSQLDMLADVFLAGPSIKSFGEQIPSATPINQNRRRKLLESTPEGRAVIREEAKKK